MWRELDAVAQWLRRRIADGGPEEAAEMVQGIGLWESQAGRLLQAADTPTPVILWDALSVVIFLQGYLHPREIMSGAGRLLSEAKVALEAYFADRAVNGPEEARVAAQVRERLECPRLRSLESHEGRIRYAAQQGNLDHLLRSLPPDQPLLEGLAWAALSLDLGEVTPVEATLDLYRWVADCMAG